MPATTDPAAEHRPTWAGPHDWSYPERPPTAPPSDGGPPYVPPTPPSWSATPPPGRGPIRVRRSSARSLWVLLAVLLGAVALIGGVLAVQSGLQYLGIAGSSTNSSATGFGPLVDPGRQQPGSSGGLSNGGPSNGGPSNGGSAAPSSWAEVAAAVDDGVVNIESRVPQGVGAGTGIILSQSGEILTNNHVIDGATQIAVSPSTTGAVYQARVIGTDPQHDIAVLQLSGASGLTPIPIGNSDEVKVGDPIAAIGNAGGQGGEPAMAPGTVAALHQQITATDEHGGSAQTLTDMIQVNADVEPGDSGGPLVNADGQVVGIDAAASSSASRYRTAEHQGYAIPINRAISIAESIEADPSGSNGSNGSNGQGAAAPGYLGVQIDPTVSVRGAGVVGVQSNSPASKAGMKVGDVITAIDDNEVTSSGELTTVMRSYQAGEKVMVTWTDANGKRHRDTLTLASG